MSRKGESRRKEDEDEVEEEDEDDDRKKTRKKPKKKQSKEKKEKKKREEEKTKKRETSGQIHAKICSCFKNRKYEPAPPTDRQDKYEASSESNLCTAEYQRTLLFHTGQETEPNYHFD